MSPEQELSRAVSSEQILNNPIYVEAKKALFDRLVDRILMCGPDDEKTERWLCHALRATNESTKVFEGHIQTGKMAEMQLKEKGFFKKLF